MELMNRVYKECLDTFVILFIDHILIYSKTDQEYQKHLRKVLTILGYIVPKDIISIDSTKIEVITKWERPNYGHQGT